MRPSRDERTAPPLHRLIGLCHGRPVQQAIPCATAFPVTVTSLVPKACFFTFAPPLAPSKCERASQQTASWCQAVSAHCCPGPLTCQALGPGHWLLPPPQPPLHSGTGPFSRRCAYAQFSCLLCLIQSSPTVPGARRGYGICRHSRPFGDVVQSCHIRPL